RGAQEARRADRASLSQEDAANPVAQAGRRPRSRGGFQVASRSDEEAPAVLDHRRLTGALKADGGLHSISIEGEESIPRPCGYGSWGESQGADEESARPAAGEGYHARPMLRLSGVSKSY